MAMGYERVQEDLGHTTNLTEIIIEIEEAIDITSETMPLYGKITEVGEAIVLEEDSLFNEFILNAQPSMTIEGCVFIFVPNMMFLFRFKSSCKFEWDKW